jgi:hypothetical protein
MFSEGFVLLTTVFAVVVVTALAALVWAAVQDGRDETAFRAREAATPPRRPPVSRSRR